MQYRINQKEGFYFFLKIISTVLLLGALGLVLKSFPKAIAIVGVFAFYAGMIAFFFFVRNGMLIGFLRGSCVRITSDQFPDIYAIYESHCHTLNLVKPPSLYIMESGGVLNAFATRFIGKDYIVILSDVLEAAYEDGLDAVSFIIAHELGHVKQKHMTKNFLTFPSLIVPFLQGAYSRACEYTCDNIGHSLNAAGAVKGMLILSVGKSLQKKVKLDKFLEDSEQQTGFWIWFSQVLMSHPFYPRRIRNLQKISV